MRKDSLSPRRVRVEEGIYLEGGSWVAGFRCPISGKWKTKKLSGVNGVREARKARRALIADLEARRAAPSSKEAFADAADRWIQSRRGRVRPRTLETDERAIGHAKRYFGRRALQSIEPRDVESFLGALRAGKGGLSGRPFSEWSVVGALAALRAVLEMGVRDGALPFNPCGRLAPHIRPKQVNRRQAQVLTAAQVDALVQAAVKRTPAYAAVIATAAYTGARIREVLALRWKDIDHDAKLIHLRGQLNVAGTEIVAMKTKESERLVTLVPKLEPHLGRAARMKSPWSGDEDFVFSAARARPKEYRNVRRALAVASEEAGLPVAVRAHDLRHSFTSLMIQHTDLQTVANAVGHKNILVTARVYSHALGSPEERAERAARAAAAAGLGY